MRRRFYARRLVGILFGIALAVLLSGAAWHVPVDWFPPPLNDIIGDRSDVPSVREMPFIGLMAIAIGLFAAGFVGAFVSLRISQWRPAGWLAVSVVVLFGVSNAIQIAEPTWLALASIIAPLVGAWLAERHFHRARPGDSLIG